jgi:hypothetical protein
MLSERHQRRLLRAHLVYHKITRPYRALGNKPTSSARVGAGQGVAPTIRVPAVSSERTRDDGRRMRWIFAGPSRLPATITGLRDFLAAKAGRESG